MNKANQNALYQQTNQGLLGIRQAEISYYINLCVAFGTQAALVGGFTYGIFTQNQFNEETGYSKYFQDVYWVSSSGTIAASVHVILTSMLLQVLGPGLALHGPIGSMARACEGMRREQRTVITAFIIMIVLFSISTILSFWAVMTTFSAAGSTLVWLVASRYYYIYCERIYLRFYWKEEKDYWRRSADFSDDPAGVSDDYEPPAVTQTKERLNALHRMHGENRESFEKKDRQASVQGHYMHDDDDASRRRSRSISTSKAAAPAKRRLFNVSFPFRRSKKADAKSRSSTDNPLTTSLLTSQVADSTPQGLRELAMEGFLLIKRFSYSLSTSDKHSFKWERRYFTLNYLGHLFYYNSRTDFRENPRRPIHKRPLMLQDFFVVVRNSERDGDNVSSFRSVDSNMPGLERAHSITSTLSAATAMTPGHNHYDTGNRGKSGVHVFEITLIPRENEKQFRRLNLQQHQHQQLVAGGQEIDSRRGDSDDNMSQSDHDSVSNEETETSKFLGKQEYKRDWVLRCDTAEELTVWVDVIRDVCPSCFR